MKRKFWLVTYRDEDGEMEGESLTTKPDYYKGEDCTVEPIEEPSGVLLAEWMDSNAENWNHHSLVGVHEYLYKRIAAQVGTEDADVIFQDLADKEEFLGQRGY